MNKKMNKKKENRMAVRQAAATAVLRDEQNRRIQFAATNPEGEVLKNLRTTLRGLDVEAVAASRAKYGSNKVTHEKKKSLARRLAGAFINPFTAILFCLALVSTMTDMVFPYFSLLGSVPEDFDPLTVIIILTMVFISGTLRFVQESRSGNAAEKLLAMITTTCMVTRQEQEKVEIPMDDLVVGDIVHLSAGDMIPADVRILEAKDLFVSQASLTGESEPIEKTPLVSAPRDSVTDYTDIAFMGSNVISGSATAVAVCVGDQTLFGSMASAVAGEAVETSFTKGVNAVSWVLIRFMMVMVPLVFFINGITKGDWLEAFLFGISIAVGLTPGDAAHDRDHLPCQGCRLHEQKADHREKSELHPELRCNRYPLHRQDRHPDPGQGGAGISPERQRRKRYPGIAPRLPEQLFPDRL